MAAAASPKANRLIREKSPYLLQHAHNPVDWYPWGKEAFDLAKERNVPIFLSIGYFSCHWCHVLEKESFENEGTAEIMNANFVNIKVDREERPDIDQIYMTFVQATTGHGGWPLSVWLTPDLKPFFGGTYYPPHDRFGRPGFPTVLKLLASKWKQEKDKLIESSNEIVRQLQQINIHKGQSGSEATLSYSIVEKCLRGLEESFDGQHGGFSDSPKFPTVSILNFLLRYSALISKGGKEESCEAFSMVAKTLTEMSRGGINDQISSGFHRYSTDAVWHVPHFEKMLYDQSQLAMAYFEAHQISGAPEFAQTGESILEYVKRDLSDREGGFYCAEDADSLPSPTSPHSLEGAFYAWEAEELEELLREDYEMFAFFYGVKAGGNVPRESDIQGELKGKNVLFQRVTVEAAAKQFDLSPEKVQATLQGCKSKLFKARNERPRPNLDDKVITAWNGMMISALCKGFQALGDSSHLERAKKAARFLEENMYHRDRRMLLRSYRKGPSEIEGFAEDYAFLIAGLLDLYESTFDERHLLWARELQEVQDSHFWDEEGGGYFGAKAREGSDLILRMKEASDNASPSANSVAAMNLFRLAEYFPSQGHGAKLSRLLSSNVNQLTRFSQSLTYMTSVLHMVLAGPLQVVIVGERDDAATLKLVQEAHKLFIPNRVMMLLDSKTPWEAFDEPTRETLKGFQQVGGKPTAYVCKDFVCSLPVNTPEDLKARLESRGSPFASP